MWCYLCALMFMCATLMRKKHEGIKIRQHTTESASHTARTKSSTRAKSSQPHSLLPFTFLLLHGMERHTQQTGMPVGIHHQDKLCPIAMQPQQQQQQQSASHEQQQQQQPDKAHRRCARAENGRKIYSGWKNALSHDGQCVVACPSYALARDKKPIVCTIYVHICSRYARARMLRNVRLGIFMEMMWRARSKTRQLCGRLTSPASSRDAKVTHQVEKQKLCQQQQRSQTPACTSAFSRQNIAQNGDRKPRSVVKRTQKTQAHMKQCVVVCWCGAARMVGCDMRLTIIIFYARKVH